MEGYFGRRWELAAEPSFSPRGLVRVGSTPSIREECEGDRVQWSWAPGDCGKKGTGGRDFKVLPEQLINRQGWWEGSGALSGGARSLHGVVERAQGWGLGEEAMSYGTPSRPSLTSL